jgi:hypothetical protein
MKNSLLRIDGWVYDPFRKAWIHPSGRVLPIIRGAGMANAVQQAFWFRNNDGNEATATFMGAQGSDQTLPVDTIFRIRIIVEETAGGVANVGGNLHYQRNGAGGYIDITGASTHVQAVDEAQSIADDTLLTTQRLTYSGTYVSGRYDDDGVATTNVTLDAEFTEFEFSIKIIGSAVNHGDTIDLRVYDAALALDVYSVTPRATVTKARTPRYGFTNFQVPGIV